MTKNSDQKGQRRGLITILLLIGAALVATALYIFNGDTSFTPAHSSTNIPAGQPAEQITAAQKQTTVPKPIGERVFPMPEESNAPSDLPTQIEVQIALEASLKNSAEGRNLVQSYFDRSGGDADALLKRGERLVSALKNRVMSPEPIEDILVPIQTISDALDNSAEAVFIVPVLLDPRHKNDIHSTAYDFGPEGKPAFSDYQRYALNEESERSGVSSFEISDQSLLLNDGIEGASALSLPAKSGHRKVTILTTGFRNPTADRPFVDGLSAEGRNSRVVWLDDLPPPVADAGAQWMELGPNGAVHHPWSEIKLPDNSFTENSPIIMGYAAVLPAVPIIGDLDLRFHQIAGSKAALNGAIISPTNMPAVIDEVKGQLWDLYTPPIVAVLPQIELDEQPTLGSVTVAEALDGAISGTLDGLDQLQAFMNATAGNIDELRLRAEALLNALSQSNIANNFIAVADTANRILESAINSAQSGYILPAYISPDFKLNDQQFGWDFGQQDRNAFHQFVRVGENNTLVTGDRIEALEGLSGEPITSDALLGVDGFYPELPDGSYRLFMLAPAQFEGEPVARPFGSEVRVSGGAIKTRDLRQADPPIWGRFSVSGFSLHDGADSIENYLPSPDGSPKVAQLSTLISYNPDQIPEPESLILSARALVEGGRLRLQLEIPNGERSLVSGIIIEESDISELEDYLASKVANILTEAGPRFSEQTPSAFATPATPSPSNNGGNNGGSFGGAPGISPPGTSIGGNPTTPSPTNPPADPVDPPAEPIDPPVDPIDPDDPIVITADAGGPYTVFFGDVVEFDGSAEFNVDPSLLSVEWLLNVDGQDFLVVSGFADDIDIFSPEFLANLPPGTYELILRLTFLDVVEEATTFLTILLQAAVPAPPGLFLFLSGLVALLLWRRRNTLKK